MTKKHRVQQPNSFVVSIKSYILIFIKSYFKKRFRCLSEQFEIQIFYSITRYSLASLLDEINMAVILNTHALTMLSMYTFTIKVYVQYCPSL